MKQFDWKKNPEIDVVAWDENGNFYGWKIATIETCWFGTIERLPEYDIDPTTEGFDWTKSKQIRPSKYLIDEINSQINISSMDRVELRKIKELNEELFRNREGLIAECVGYREKIVELESELHKFQRSLAEKEIECSELNGIINLLEKDLDAKYSKNEKLIDFVKDRLTHELNTTRSYLNESDLDSLGEQLIKEATVLGQAIERIEKHATPNT